MKKIDDRLLNAYIDNELSVSEVEELEQQLSKEELQCLISERKLESSLNNVFKDAPKCSEDLWNNIVANLDEEPATQKERSKSPLLFGVILAAAASIFIFINTRPGNYPAWVPKTVAELTQKSQVEMDRMSVNQFIAKNGVELKLGEFPKTHHGNSINLLGAALEKMAGDDVVTLYFDCCGEPAKVFLIPNNSAADKFINEQEDAGTEGIVENTVKGDYRVALVSSHNASELVASISEI